MDEVFIDAGSHSCSLLPIFEKQVLSYELSKNFLYSFETN